ncbi:complement C6, partial [Chelydra serpentina]
EPESGCLKPSPPENGFLRNEKNHYAFGEEAEIACVTGYDLIGYQFLRCLPDHTWAQQPVECQSSMCPKPSVSEGVTISPFKNEYKVGETIQLRCPTGFIVTGGNQFTCRKEVSWTPPILRSLTCEKDEQTKARGNCSPGQKQVGSQCVCMSPAHDCGHYSEDVCVLHAVSESPSTKPSCQYLAEKCLNEQPLHFLHSGPCHVDTNLNWAIERAKLSTSSSKKELCGYDTCYDWEKCSESQSQCFCLIPYQCPKVESQLYCIQMESTSRKRTASLCALGAMKCAGMKIEVLHQGNCLN